MTGTNGHQTARQGNNRQTRLIISVCLTLVTFGASIFWAKDFYTWWQQNQLVKQGKTVTGRISDIRFLKESKNQRYCTFEVCYTYPSNDITLRDTHEIHVPGAKSKHKGQSFARGDAHYEIGTEIDVAVRGGVAIPKAFVRSGGPVKTLGVAVFFLWVMLYFQFRRQTT